MMAGMDASEKKLLKTTTTTTDRRKKRRRRRIQYPYQSPETSNPNILLSLTVAGVIRLSNPLSEPSIKQSLKKLVQLLNPNLEPFLNPIISLLPSLLRFRGDEIALNAAKIAGGLAIVSIEANERVASDCEVLRCLVEKIRGKEKKKAVMKAACNAVLDVSTTLFGRNRLIELSCLHDLMLGFNQLRNFSSSSICINITEREGNSYLGVESSQDELQLLLLDSVVALTNSCNNEQLKRIPKILGDTLVTFMKEIWPKVQEQLLTSRPLNLCETRICYLSNLTACSLAESIFRLSMDAPTFACPIQSEIIVQRIFGSQQSSFMNFMSEHWESSPFMVTEVSSEYDVLHDIFSSFKRCLDCDESESRFLSSILRRMVSCPPVALNEINTLSFLSDVRGTVGCPISYQQDIRVVRASLNSKSEEHYFQEISWTGTQVKRSFSIDDFLKCEVAYREGYTVALRGMQFRFKSIAAISQEIAYLFGQPSVGANLYVTPPNSQGLACHFDDHCVFVCQLRGTKEWTVFPKPVVHLPRLYEHLEVPQDLMESKQILLKEGDVLYIPRGFAHKARTVTGVDTSSGNDESSVHLTLAIDVEPPFLWEGFAHVALHHWGHDQSFAFGSSWDLEAISVNILHVSIQLISENVFLFRKACLAAAGSLPPDTKDWSESNQRTIFNEIIKKIDDLASFEDSIEFLERALQRNENPFHWLRWLEPLKQGKMCGEDSWNYTSDEICKILSFIYQHKEDARVAFAHVKSKFCSKVLFHNAKEWFITLYSIYKHARMQYMNGMLSLHC